VLLFVGLAWAGADLGFRLHSTQVSETSRQRS
jgi:hypothetical protein